MFLLDTMIVSESFKRVPDDAVVNWLRSVPPSSLFISAMTFGEISAGLEKQRSANHSAVSRLEAWVGETRRLYEAQTIAVSTDIAIRWGMLSMRLRRRDMDVLIAATALEHDFTIATRNIRHFSPIGVKLLNPYET